MKERGRERRGEKERARERAGAVAGAGAGAGVKRLLPENLVLRPYHNDYFESM